LFQNKECWSSADDVMSDVNSQNNNSLNNFLVITETAEYGQVESKKLVQTADEFPKLPKACDKT